MVCLCVSEVFRNCFGTKTAETVPFRKINSAICLHFYFSIFGSKLYTFLHCIWTVFIKYTYAIRIWALVIFFELENKFFWLAELAVAEVAEAETEKSHENTGILSLSECGNPAEVCLILGQFILRIFLSCLKRHLGFHYV